MTKLSHRLEMLGVRALVAVLRRFPLVAAQSTGAWLAQLARRPLGIRRKVVERQIQAAFPGLSRAEVTRIARASYAHFGRVAVEVALLAERDRSQVLDLFAGTDDLTPLEDALVAERGVVLVTGHVGSWELAAVYLAARGIAIEAVARHMQNPLFDAYLKQVRERLGLHVIYDDHAVRSVPRSLRQGRAVALVSDQGVKGLASVFVPFFGRPAKTPRGAAVFAYRFGAAAFFVAAMRQPSGKYWFHLRPIPVSQAPDRETAIDQTVAAYTRILESFVRRHPEQYFWLHRRWRRQPPDTPEELRDPAAMPAAAESV